MSATGGMCSASCCRSVSWLGCLLLFFQVGCDISRPVSSAARGPTIAGTADVAAGRPAGAEEAATPPDSLQPDDWFEDLTDRTGIAFACQNGREARRYYIIESFGGGVAMVDYDLDGDVDLFFTGGGTISPDEPVRIGGRDCPLFRNEGSWRFGDVTAASGLAGPPDYSQGCAVTDFDVDGFPDLFVCCIGHSRLYRNQGDGTYGAVDLARLETSGWGTAAAFGDFDRDGWPDLFLARYTEWSPQRDVICRFRHAERDLCGPTSYSGTVCQFFHNSGNGAFEDWSERVGLQAGVRGLGVVATDLNGDGWIDFFVASDDTPNHLYLGGPELRFTEGAELAGVALGQWGAPQASMGVDIADYDGDGLPDLWITNFEQEDDSLYRNVGQGLFTHAAAAAGLLGPTRMRVGFGTSLSDFDGDGWPDLFVLNGHTSYTTGQTPFQQRPQLFQNVRGRRFEDTSLHGGTYFRSAHAGRGTAVGDLDDDGALDLVTVHINDPVKILANRRSPASFVSVRLLARNGEPDATGSRLSAVCDGRRIVRFVNRGTGFFSQFDPRIIFPISVDQPALDVIVEWVGRGSERFSRLTPRRTHLLIEGRGEPVHE